MSRSEHDLAVRGDPTTCEIDAAACPACDEDDDDSPPTQLTGRRSYCTDDHACSTRPRPAGGPCEGGGGCNDEAVCVECALDENCGANGACVECEGGS
jgi:hypothetical protein